MKFGSWSKLVVFTSLTFGVIAESSNEVGNSRLVKKNQFGLSKFNFNIKRDEHEEEEHDHDHDHEEEEHSHEHEEEHDHDHEGEEEGHTHTTFNVTGCHLHDDSLHCTDPDGIEGMISPLPTHPRENYTDCHSHGTEIYCMDGETEYLFIRESDNDINLANEEISCHMHAGVEHCTYANGTEVSSLDGNYCEKIDRDYNIPLRIGLLFVILVTSAIGSFGPLILRSLFKISANNVIIIIIKQFGTGVILSTVFIHLLTHSFLLFSSSCLTNLNYEPTSASIAMAGLFIAFVIEFIAFKIISSRIEKLNNRSTASTQNDEHEHGSIEKTNIDHNSSEEEIFANNEPSRSSYDKLSVILLEAGIVFHSILIGITLVVAADTYFITLFIVIVFHQFFEGLALGSRIIILNTSVWTKMLMAFIFAITTPIGMAIGVGTLNIFNGNDPSTIIALGVLQSASAGILLWTGLVEFLYRDWFFNLKNASWFSTACAMLSLVLGLFCMSLLGNWA
ncbi:ZRT1 [Candida pseudojiufengensis]|uniref:ZRT1 n=1 Tax=Candida pseudojiufengensis TaxID=497109 RepID=UPI002225AAAC|nr:ZRT1 [Candida pseudojiufengensis]KAI5965966.1 ZRT1 [Candida pseudojiufengensis]